MKMIDYALNYRKLGYSPIPLKPNQKIPAIKDWQQYADRPPDKETLQQWFARNKTGIGIVLGSRLAVIDFESLELYQRWLESSEQARKVAEKTWVVRTRRGVHVWLRLTSPVKPMKAEGMWELRTGKQQCVVPPTTIRVNGEKFEYASLSGFPSKLVKVSPEQLMFLLSKLPGLTAHHADPDARGVAEKQEDELPQRIQPIVALLAPFWKEGERHLLALGLSGMLAKEGWPEDWAEQTIRQLANRGGDEEIEDRVRAVRDTYDKWRRGQEIGGVYLLRELLPPGIVGALGELVGATRPPESVQKANQIRLAKQPQILRLQNLTDFIASELWKSGFALISAEDGETSEAYLFDEKNGTVIPIRMDSEGWGAILRFRFGINPEEKEYRYVTSDMRLRARERGRRAKVARYFHFDPRGGVLQISNHRGGIWVLSPGAEPVLVSNGSQGIFFLEEPGAAFDPDWGSPLNPFEFLAHDLPFASDVDIPLPPEQQRLAFAWWWGSVFFQNALRSKPILVCYGPPGSGKTTAIRRFMMLLMGEVGDLLTIPLPNGVRDFIASLGKRPILALDNVDERIPWLPPMLESLVTGGKVDLRKLYTTNQEAIIDPKCMMVITTQRLPFFEGEVRRESLLDRMLILRFRRLRKRRDDEAMLRSVLENRNRLWAGLIRWLGEVLPHVIDAMKRPEHVQFRMAGWANLIRAFARAEGREEELEALLDGLVRSKAMAVIEESPLPTLLNVVVPKWPRQGLTAGEIYTWFVRVARKLKLELPWRTPKELSYALRQASSTLEEVYGLRAQRDAHLKVLRWVRGQKA